jgi:acetate kinase
VDLAVHVVRVLVVNAGSSSLKLRLLDDTDAMLASADLPAGATSVDTEAVSAAVQDWPVPDAIGHRVVHGGTRFAGPVRVDSTVRGQLDELTALAPLHQPKSLTALDAVSAVYPDVPAVACFDTAFHATLPDAAFTYPVPRDWQTRHGVRRYGFHGLSHAYCSARAAQLLARPDDQLRLVTCHLGAGASLAAVVGGRSVDTTMGFTPLEGLMMATRSGSVDPGLVLWLEEHERLRPHEVAVALEQRSGLLALCGTPDLREVERRAAAGDADARLGLDVYLHRLVSGIGAMAASTRGLDALAFTGGVGEHSALVRERACAALGWLGVVLDVAANAAVAPDADVAADGSAVRVLVVAAREDLQIATSVRQVLHATGESPEPNA